MLLQCYYSVFRDNNIGMAIDLFVNQHGRLSIAVTLITTKKLIKIIGI